MSQAPVVPLTTDHVEAALRLSDAAGWNQMAEDWQRVVRLQPDGCFGIFDADRLVATATAVCYGRDLSWIGMVLTDPERRGRGYARALMEHALEWLEGRRVRWIKLDATDMGRPLYAKLGFEDECGVERWKREPGPYGGDTAPLNDFRFDSSLDQLAFGADRGAVLRDLRAVSACASSGAGYVMMREGRRARYIGPCVSRDAARGRASIEWCVAQHSAEPLFWDILPDNEAAVECARQLGFAPVRKLVRMTRRGPGAGDPIAARNEYMWAIAGFEYG